jgi:hypothetical protein
MPASFSAIGHGVTRVTVEFGHKAVVAPGCSCFAFYHVQILLERHELGSTIIARAWTYRDLVDVGHTHHRLTRKHQNWCADLPWILPIFAPCCPMRTKKRSNQFPFDERNLHQNHVLVGFTTYLTQQVQTAQE